MSEAPRDPMRAAQANMRPATIKRFYRTVDVGEATGGQHALTLDGRGARTPGRNLLAAKSRALMLKVAAEWERQRETIEPADMPLTRLINSASCSPRASSPSARARIAAVRSATGVRDHAGNAARAAATARSTSAPPPRGTRPMTSSVRLSITSMSPSVVGWTHWPPM